MILEIFMFYILGCIIAFIAIVDRYFWFNASIGKDIRYIFSNPKDIRELFLLSLGSWVTIFKIAND